MTSKQKAQPLVSLIVLNWNGKRFMDAFMKSFLNQTYPLENVELIYTDNDSSDDSIAYLKKTYGNLPQLKIVLNDKNYGYSGGNDLGIKQARGDYILLCNQDLKLDKNLIKELVATAQAKKAAAVVPKLMYLNKVGVINNAGSRLEPNSDWPVYDEGIDQKDAGQFDKVREISAFCGACVMLSRKFLQTVGLFDKHFFMYFEDGDLSWRGQKAGFKYYYEPRAVAHHVHAGSSKAGSPLFNHFVGRNRVLILAKNARLIVLLKGIAKTWRDHFLHRIKNLIKAAIGKYNPRQSLKEFYLSQKMLLSIIFMLPYAFFKRWRLLKEEKL